MSEIVAEPLLYSYLTDALDQQLPATLIRLILSLIDVVLLSQTESDDLLQCYPGVMPTCARHRATRVVPTI